jgi:hypothetical protein
VRQTLRVILFLCPLVFTELHQKIIAASDDQGMLVGVWGVAWTDPNNGRMTSQIILRKDGRFQKQDAGKDVGIITTIEGTFKVDPERRFLRLETENGTSCGPNRCIAVVVSESWTYRFGDRNSLELRAANCPECYPLTYKRQA